VLDRELSPWVLVGLPLPIPLSFPNGGVINSVRVPVGFGLVT
jgi:hypothetical protein